ncbi:MAG: hypothetical protein WBH77_07750 [Saccharofermentanales bacterium]
MDESPPSHILAALRLKKGCEYVLVTVWTPFINSHSDVKLPLSGSSGVSGASVYDAVTL